MYFPITVVDNFYDNFDQIKELADKAQYYKKEIFTMPGVESKPLNEIDPLLYQQACHRILALFFNRHGDRDHLRWTCSSRFEKIIPYGKHYDKGGWVHNDDNNKLSGILFLQGNDDEGTSFYSNTEAGVFHNQRLVVKEKLHRGIQVDPKEYNFNLKEPFKAPAIDMFDVLGEKIGADKLMTNLPGVSNLLNCTIKFLLCHLLSVMQVVMRLQVYLRSLFHH